ncbi:MAG TPA: glycosyltransferase family 1 protein [Thermoanaerobaculia bacterium]|nr:glycosyltransferase family 1 protein [Thermoanaerobaculia bacterium]
MWPTVRDVVHTLSHAAAERLERAAGHAVRRDGRLRIGVDIRPFYEPLTGVGWYLYHLLHHLARRDDVELVLLGDARVTDEGPRLHADLPPSARLCVFDLRGRPRSRAARSLTAGAYVLWMWLLDCDLIFGANYFLPRLMSAVARRRVITIHDLTYKRFPELLQKETLHNLGSHMMREIAAADAVICVSKSTRRDLLEFYQIDPARVVVIHSGLPALPDPEPVPGLPPRYILFVSTIEPRKNLGVLLDAFARLRRGGRYDGSLVVAGKIGWKADAIARRLAEPGVVHLDYVPPAQLAALYRGAEVFVLPSLYEGFGFPMLEAMAHGTPVIAARSSSLPEIGGEAGLYFDPRDTGGLVAALERIAGDGALREEMIARGRTQASLFRWETAAEQTMDVFRRAAGK